jgi:hypothetical protein
MERILIPMGEYLVNYIGMIFLLSQKVKKQKYLFYHVPPRGSSFGCSGRARQFILEVKLELKHGGRVYKTSWWVGFRLAHLTCQE